MESTWQRYVPMQWVTIGLENCHDDVTKWKHFPRNWPFVRGIHRSPVNFPHKDQWRGALMFSLICIWKNDWKNNREASDWRHYRAHYHVIVMAPARCLSRTNAILLSPVHKRLWNLTKIFSFGIMHSRMSSAKRQPYCSGLDKLNTFIHKKHIKCCLWAR